MTLLEQIKSYDLLLVLSGVYKFELVWYIYIYINTIVVWGFFNTKSVVIF